VEGLYPQTAVHVGSQQCAHPAGIFIAALQSAFSVPQCDYGDKSRFLIGNHDQASGKAGHLVQGAGERRRNRGLQSPRFPRKLYGP